MTSLPKGPTLRLLGDVCEDFRVPHPFAKLDCSLVPPTGLLYLQGALSLQEVAEILRRYASRAYTEFWAIAHPPPPVRIEPPKTATPETDASDAITHVTVKVGGWVSGAVTHLTRKVIVERLSKFETVSVEGNLHDGFTLNFDGHAFDLDMDGHPTATMAMAILDAWAANGGLKHTLYAMTPEEEELLPLLKQLVKYTRSFSEGRFSVSPVIPTSSFEPAIQRELVAMRAQLVTELRWVRLSTAFCLDDDAALIEMTRRVPCDWSLLGLRQCPVHENPAVLGPETAPKCQAVVECFVHPAEGTMVLPDLVDDGDDLVAIVDSRPSLVFKPSPDANLPGIARLRGENAIWAVLREVMSADNTPMSIPELQETIGDRGLNVQRRGVKRCIMAHRASFMRMLGKWALVYEARLPPEVLKPPRACKECFPVKRGKRRYPGDLSAVQSLLAHGEAAQILLQRLEGRSFALEIDSRGKASPYYAPGKVRVVRDPLACDVAVGRMSELAGRNGGLVGVALKWHPPNPCAVGSVLPVPAVVALAVSDEAILFDLDNLGATFPPALCALFSARNERKVLPCLEDVELIGTLTNNEVHNAVVLGNGANYSCSSDVLNDAARVVLNTFLSHPLGHLGPNDGLGWKEVMSIAAEASLVWRTGGELIYRRTPHVRCDVCFHHHLTYRSHAYGGSVVHEVVYRAKHEHAPEGWYAMPPKGERVAPLRRTQRLTGDALRHRNALIAFGCHVEL